ncbi:hypothetical protein ABIB73_005760 [Bradyrhizobium sp. F1.4.3]
MDVRDEVASQDAQLRILAPSPRSASGMTEWNFPKRDVAP